MVVSVLLSIAAMRLFADLSVIGLTAAVVGTSLGSVAGAAAVG